MLVAIAAFGVFLNSLFRIRLTSILFCFAFSAWCLCTALPKLSASNEADVLRSRTLQTVRSYLDNPRSAPAPYSDSPTGDEGELAQIELVVRRMLSKKAVMNKRLSEAFEQLDGEGILSETVFAGVAEMRRAVTRTREFELVVSALLDESEALIDDTDRELAGLRISGVRTDGLVSEFRRTSATSRERDRRLIASARDYASQLRRLLEFLIERKHGYEVVEREVLFHATADLDEFNSIVARIDAAAELVNSVVNEAVLAIQQAVTTFEANSKGD